MTREEAIEVFEGVSELEGISMFYQPGGKAGKLTIHGIKEASQMAISALRTQQTPAKLDRSQWEGCDYCKGDLEGYTAQFRDVEKRSRPLYIPEGEAMIVAPGKYNHRFCIPIKYCPFCGRPLTVEAWSDLERRMSNGTDD